MKSVPRVLALLGLLAFCAMQSLTPALAQNAAHNPVFEKITPMEKTEPAQKALEEYARIKNEKTRSEPEVAAEALLRAALFASSEAYGRVDEAQFRKEIRAEDPNTLPEPVKERRAAMRADGDFKAHEALKQLFNEFPNSQAAKQARDLNLQKQLEDRMDRANSQTISWKIVDALVGLTGRIPAFSYWFALLVIAALVKLLTWPLTLKMYKSQKEMQRVAPLLKEIQEKYKGKPELTEKTMAVYREHGVSPFASCLPMLIQLPFMIWVYNMIRMYEYHFSHGTFLWIGSSLSFEYPAYLAQNLARFDYILLVLYAASNYITMRLTPPSDPQMAQQQKTMALMMTGMMFYFFLMYKWSAAFTLYWLALNLISTWQQYKYIYKKTKEERDSFGESGLKPATANGADIKTAARPASGSNGSAPKADRPATPLAGSETPRPRPRRKKR